MATFLGILLSLTALLLIIVVLIQRGRGGGLAGALGGGGGQSAFGTKAGDLLTKITVGLATFWILLCIVTLRALSASSSKFSTASPAGQTAPCGTRYASSAAVPAKTDKSSGTDKSTTGSGDKTGGSDKSSSSTGSDTKASDTTKPTTTAAPSRFKILSTSSDSRWQVEFDTTLSDHSRIEATVH